MAKLFLFTSFGWKSQFEAASVGWNPGLLNWSYCIIFLVLDMQARRGSNHMTCAMCGERPAGFQPEDRLWPIDLREFGLRGWYDRLRIPSDGRSAVLINAKGGWMGWARVDCWRYGLKFCSQRSTFVPWVWFVSLSLPLFLLFFFSDIPSNPRYPHTTLQRAWCSDLRMRHQRGYCEQTFRRRSSCPILALVESELTGCWAAATLYILVNQVIWERLGCASSVLNSSFSNPLGIWMRYLIGSNSCMLRFSHFSSSLRMFVSHSCSPPHIIHCEISKHLRAIACCSDVGWASWGWLLGPVFHWTDRSSSCS